MPENEVDWLLDRWRRGDRDDLAWFDLLRTAMRRGAQRGIQRMTGDRPNELDVDDAVAKAFEEFIERDPSKLTAPRGLAVQIAYRRGQDIGRKINSAREFPETDCPTLVNAPDPAPGPEEEILEAERLEEREKVLSMAKECLKELPPGQVEVIQATILKQQSLSDWANNQGKSYQAADQQRKRALVALQRCIKVKLTREGGDHVV